jgi:hypothetical protein
MQLLFRSIKKGLKGLSYRNPGEKIHPFRNYKKRVLAHR